MLIASIFSFKMIDFKIIYIYIYDLQIEKKPLVYIHVVVSTLHVLITCRFVSCGWDKKVQVWDVETGNILVSKICNSNN